MSINRLGLGVIKNLRENEKKTSFECRKTSGEDFVLLPDRAQRLLLCECADGVYRVYDCWLKKREYFEMFVLPSRSCSNKEKDYELQSPGWELIFRLSMGPHQHWLTFIFLIQIIISGNLRWSSSNSTLLFLP